MLETYVGNVARVMQLIHAADPLTIPTRTCVKASPEPWPKTAISPRRTQSRNRPARAAKVDAPAERPPLLARADLVLRVLEASSRRITVTRSAVSSRGTFRSDVCRHEELHQDDDDDNLYDRLGQSDRQSNARCWMQKRRSSASLKTMLLQVRILAEAVFFWVNFPSTFYPPSSVFYIDCSLFISYSLACFFCWQTDVERALVCYGQHGGIDISRLDSLARKGDPASASRVNL